MSAEGIFANLIFAVPFGILMLLLFAYLRSVLSLFYHRNVLIHGKAVFGVKIEKNFFAWFRGLIQISDDVLLRLAGLDALVTSNGFRLMILFTCVMAVPCLLILCPYYYSHSDHSDGVDFDTFTISDLYTDTFWPPLLVLVFLTALILYGVYSFFTNFIRMRQAYLLRPSGLSSTGALMNTSEAFGSIKYARRRPDSAVCTVLLHPIPPDIGSSPEKLKESLEKSGVSGITSVQYIGNYHKLKECIDKRNSSLKKLEKALKTVCDKLEKSDKTRLEMKDKMSVKDRSDLLFELISNVSLCSALRPRHKTSQPASKDPEPQNSDGTVDSLRHFYKKLTQREEELQEALKEFNTPQNISAAKEEGTDEPVVTEDFEKRYIEETTFISWKKVFDFSANLAHVSSLTSQQSALLHFSDYRSATRAHQILLTSRGSACMAPNPEDLNWNCIQWSEHQRWKGALKSNLCYWALVLLFAPISAAIVALVDLEGLGKWSEAIETFRQNHPNLREILQSVIAPLMATLLMKRTGIMINRIMSMRGPLSKSELILKTQSAHLFFLVTQVVIIGALFSNIYQMTATALVKSPQNTLLGHLRENVPKKAHFFFNFMIQDIFNELMLELLNPKSLFFDRTFLKTNSRKDKSTRSLFEHDTNPPELELAIVWSRFIMFPFFIFMTYAIIAPLIVIPAIAYYSVAYVVYRFRFAEYGRRSIETGGLYWRQCSRQVIYALIIAQLSVLLQYTQFRRGFVPSIILLILFCFTILFIPLLHRNFGRSCETISVLEDDVIETKKMVQSLLHEQNNLIPAAVECLDDSEIIKSRLDAELREHINFADIDPMISDNQIQPKMRNGIILEIEDQISTFDEYQIDSLVDTDYATKQYGHPLILKHYQAIIVPSSLPLFIQRQVAK